jgi:hypothetical protein
MCIRKEDRSFHFQEIQKARDMNPSQNITQHRKSGKVATRASTQTPEEV